MASDSKMPSSVSHEKGAIPTDVEGDFVEPQQGSAPDSNNMRSVLGKKGLIIAWVGLLLVSFINYLDGVTTATFTVYALSELHALSTEAALLTISGVVTIAINGPMAVLKSHFDGFPIFAVGVMFSAIGLIIQPSSSSSGGFIAGYSLFSVGVSISRFMVMILGAELSDIRYRALSIAIVNLPAIVSVLAGGTFAQRVLPELGWRWGFGLWAIIVPTISLPLLVMQFIARRRRTARTKSSDRPTAGIIYKALLQQDIIGVILLVAGVGMLLLPIPLETGGVDKYVQARILAPTIIGLALLIVFVFWEINLAKFPLAPARVIRNRSVIAGLGCNVVNTLALVQLTPYLYTYVVVAGNMSISAATYVSVIISSISAVVAIVYGFILSWAKRGKWLFVVTNGIWLLGIGLLYAFRDPHDHKGGFIAALVVAGLGFGGLLNGVTISQAATTPQDVPIITALFLMGSSIGSSVSSAVAGGIWTSILPRNLESTLPAELKGQATSFMQSIVLATGYVWGSPERDAIAEAYIETYKILITLCLVVAGLGFLLSFLVEDLVIETKPQEEVSDDLK